MLPYLLGIWPGFTASNSNIPKLKRIINELYRSWRLHLVQDTHVPCRILGIWQRLYRDQGEYIQAEQLYQRALATSEQELESQKPDVISILESYAIFLQQDRREEEAEQILHRVQELRHTGD